MSDIEWKSPDPDGFAEVGLSFPCQGEYGWRRHRDSCGAKDRDHAHLHLNDDGLIARVPFCCRSREGLLKLVEQLVAEDAMSRACADLVPTMAMFNALPEKLTPEEAATFADPVRLKRETSYWYVGS